MNNARAILTGAAMICVTLVGVFVGLPIVKATKEYNRAAEKYDFQAMCDNADALASAWSIIGPLGTEAHWRSVQIDDCGRLLVWQAQQEISRSIR